MTECTDPGVGQIADVSGAVNAIAGQRVYAACSKKKHRDTKKFYRDVKDKYSG